MAEEDERMVLRFRRRGKLKGGDNSHLKAESWVMVDEQGKQLGASVFDFEDLGCKVRDMSTTNVGDARAVLRAAVCLRKTYPDEHIVANSKHTRPDIIAKGKTQLEAMTKALAADVNSPFGGIWAFSHTLEYKTAEFANKVFAEAFIASDFEEGAAELLRDTDPKNNPHNLGSHRNRFLFQTGELSRSDLEVQSITIAGADAFTQDYDRPFDVHKEAFVVAGNNGNRDVSSLDPEIVKAIDFGGNCAPHLNSNLVFFLVGDAIAGLGDGCGARYVAAAKARFMLEMSVYAAMGSGDNMLWQRVLYDTPFTREDFAPFIPQEPKLVVFSDAFYPKPDGWIESAGIDRVHPDFVNGMVSYQGPKRMERIILKRNNHSQDYDRRLVAKAVVQPGGSLGDHYTINMSEKYGILMVLTIPPDKADRYMEGLKPGKKQTVKGRRFFNHQCF